MRAGSLDRKVTLQRFTVTQDEMSGEEIQAWAELATVWANVRQASGGEYLKANQVQAVQRTVFQIRHYPGLTMLDRVIYDGPQFNIDDVRELGRREGTEIHAIARAD